MHRVLVLALVSFVVCARVEAATFTVNYAGDKADILPGDGVCETATNGGDCTVRAAVQEADALAGADLIVIPAGTYNLTIAPAGTADYSPATGDLELLEDVQIRGAGAGLTIIDGGGLDRIFEVAPFGGSVAAVIEGLTIRNGNADGGGGILNYTDLTLRHCAVTENTTDNSGGGGIKSATGSTLLVEDCVISNNDETNSSGGGIAALGTATFTLRDSLVEGNTAAFTGGGLSLEGTSTIEGTTIRNNVANTPAAFTFYGGGGIASEAILTIRNSTLRDNVSTNTGGGGLQNMGNNAFLINVTISGNTAATQGGGLWHNFQSGTLSLYNCTITNNSAPTGGGLYHADYAGNYTISSQTVLANNTGGNCAGPPVAPWGANHNLDSGTTCGFTGPGDLSNTDPLLGPLADNGGLVQTRALLPGSPALDAGNPTDCPTPFGTALVEDARGAARPLDGDGDGTAICDIGAYEHFNGIDLIFEDGFGDLSLGPLASAGAGAWP